MDASFEVTTSEDSITIEPIGEIDFRAADFMVGVFVSALLEHRPAIARIDLAQVPFLDSQGLAALVACYKTARDAGVWFSVINVSGTPARLLEITGVSALFELPVLQA